MKHISPNLNPGLARFESLLCAGILSFLTISSPAQLQTQPLAPSTPVVVVKTRTTSDSPQAVVISLVGKCEISEGGKDFAPLKVEQVVTQGAVLRTGEGARADLFFRRIGTSVRLQSDTEIVIEKMKRTDKGDEAQMETLLDLRKGRIFTVVRSMVAGSKFEIRNAAGRSVVEGGGGKGRYIITADGTHVTEKNSTAPLKLVRETGITVILPGEKFDRKEGKVFKADAPNAVTEYVQFDEIELEGEKTEAAPKK